MEFMLQRAVDGSRRIDIERAIHAHAG